MVLFEAGGELQTSERGNWKILSGKRVSLIGFSSFPFSDVWNSPPPQKAPFFIKIWVPKIGNAFLSLRGGGPQGKALRPRGVRGAEPPQKCHVTKSPGLFMFMDAGVGN